MNKFQLSVQLGVVVVFVAAVILSTVFYRESFDPLYKSIKDTYARIGFFTSPSTISTGDVRKYKDGDEFTYDFKFVLPEANSTFQTVDATKPFNAPTEVKDYILFVGDADKSNMNNIGVISRSQDGYYKKMLKSKMDYKYACVVMGDSIISCVDMN
jgi:hypothetical protein